MAILNDLSTYQGPDEIVPISEYPIPSGGKIPCFKSAFDSFEEKLGGIEVGEVVVISGHRKEGKTLFAESWLRSIMRNDPAAKTTIFSFEVMTHKLIQKYIGDDSVRIYVPRQLKTMDFEWLRDRCQEGRDKYGAFIVLIDHLHFMVDMKTQQNMSLNIGAFMRRLKQDIAIGLNMAVVLIAHQGQAERGQSASIYSIRDSSFVAQEADSIICVTRRENYNGAELKEFECKYGEGRAMILRSLCEGYEDPHSAGLAVVSIERTRRTGAYEYKKLFRKNGEFMEEV
jgi:replicative DNA helicase